jgi:phage shock protein E
MNRLFLILFLLAGCSQKPAEEAQESSLTAAEFNSMLAGDVVVLDVRTPEEFSSGFIQGAVNLDFKAANFAQQLDSLDKSKNYLVYCAAGGRSSRASDLMQQKGFTSVKTLDGGIGAWEAEGLALTKE